MTASDPSTSDPDLHTIQSFVLQPGLSVSSGTPTNEVLTRVWNTPYYLGSVESGFGSNNFCVVGRGGLFDCMGVAPGSVYPCYRPASSGSYEKAPSWNFDLAPWIAYFLSTYYYLANMQENYMYYSRGAYSLTFGSDPIASISLTGLGFHEALCGFDPNNFIKAIQNLGFLTADPPFSGVNFDLFGNPSFISQYPEFICWLLMGAQAHGGLFSVPYRPDFFNNIIKIGDSPSINIPVIDSSGETGYAVAIPDLRFYNKVQNAMDRIFVGAGRFGDQLRTLFGTNSNPYTNKPDFLGIWQASLNPTNTVLILIPFRGSMFLLLSPFWIRISL